MEFYKALKDLICHFEPGAANEFEEFEEFIKGGFLK